MKNFIACVACLLVLAPSIDASRDSLVFTPGWALRRRQPPEALSLAAISSSHVEEPKHDDHKEEPKHEDHKEEEPAHDAAKDEEESHEEHGSSKHGSDELEHGDPGHVDEHGHVTHSIFRMDLDYLDCWEFWLIVWCMLVFTLFVDRFQWFITNAASTNRCNRMFVERVIGELMMFGVVSISVFIFSQLSSMTQHFHHLFEFCDVLCSFAACFLILMGIILFFLRLWYQSSLESKIIMNSDDILSKLDEIKDLNELDSGTVSSLVSSVKRARFFARHKLSVKNFSWNLFVVETFNQEICDLINLNWITWIATIIVTALVLMWRYQFGHLGNTVEDLSHPHLVSFVICSWGNWLACIVLYICMLASDRSVTQKLGLSTVEGMRSCVEEAKAIEATISKGEHATAAQKHQEFDEAMAGYAKTARLFAQLSQILALGLCFMLGFYVMHINYNISHFPAGEQTAWHAAMLIPLVTGLCILLPLSIMEVAKIQSFCDPSTDVMDSVMEQVAEAATDLQFIRKQMDDAAEAAGKSDDASGFMLELGKANNVESDGLIHLGEFRNVLVKVGAKVSCERANRVFQWITKDRGQCTYGKLLHKVFKETSPRKSP